jgi:hypothetical protein
MEPNTVITLDIGGKIFRTRVTTLSKTNYFSAMFEMWSRSSEAKEIQTIFLDRSPTTFKHVLALLQDPLYPFPHKYLYELGFYGIDPPANVDDSYEKLMEKIHARVDSIKDGKDGNDGRDGQSSF